jgi:flavin prenyltransferase
MKTLEPIVLAMTGASGAVYAVRLLQQLLLAKQPVHCVYSPSLATVVDQELGIKLAANGTTIDSLVEYTWPSERERWGSVPSAKEALRDQLLFVHHYQDYMTPIASGSFLTRGMIICPCSGATLSGVVHAAGNNLIQRAADVHLKERRPLVLVPRETPMSTFQLENMYRASQAGATVLPAMPGWYHGVASIVDLADFVVARVLDQFRIEHRLMKRWGDST